MTRPPLHEDLASPRVWALIGLAVYAIGSLTALWLGSATIFQRFGSLGVAAAILFFTDRLLKIELDRQRAVERILHEYGVELEVMKEGIPPTEIPRQGYGTDYLNEEQSFQRLRAQAEAINSRNIFLLTVSTLQWGFGDLFLTWVRT